MPNNEYDILLQSDENPLMQVNPYTTAVAEMQVNQKTELQQAMVVASEADPERVAKAARLAGQFNIPPNIVERNLELFEKKAAIHNTDYGDIMKRSPGLANWLRDPNNASIAKDDIPSLSKMDQAARLIQQKKGAKSNALSLPGETVRAAGTGWWNLGASTWHLGAAYGLTDINTAAPIIAEANRQSQELRNKAPDYAKEFNLAMEKEGGDVDKAWQRFTGSFKEARDGLIIQALKDFGAGGGMTVAEAVDMVGAAAWRPRGLLYSTAENFVYSLPSLVLGAAGAKIGAAGGGAIGAAVGAPSGPGATATGGIGAAIGGIAGFVGGAWIGEVSTEIGAWINENLTKRGFDITNADDIIRAYKDPKLMAEIRSEAERKGLGTATVDAVFNVFAGKFLAGAKPGITSKVVRGAADVAVQAVGETTSEAAGQVAAYKGDISKVRMGEAIQEGIISLGHSVGETLIGQDIRATLPKNTTDGAAALADGVAKAQAAQHDAQALTEMGNAVKESKTAQRVPDAVKELIDVATEGGEATKVYFQTDEWDKYWTDKGTSPARAAEQILGDAAAYHQAKETGHQLEIPLSDYVSKVGPTEDFNGLMPVTRTRMGGMTLTEAKDFMQSLPATMEELAKEATEAPQETEIRKSAREVEQAVKDQLTAIGVPTNEAAKQAKLYGERYRIRGQLLGEDPMELFKKTGVSITREDIAKEGTILLSQEAPQVTVPTFYSKMERTLDEKMPENAPVQQVQAILKDAKEEERKWSGIDEFLKGKEKVSKQELLDFVRGNQVKIEEKTLGEPLDEQIQAETDRLANLEYEDKLRAREDLDPNFEEPRDDGRWVVHGPNADSGDVYDTQQEAEKVADTLNAQFQDNIRNDIFNSLDYASLQQQAKRNLKGVSEPRFHQYTLPGGENYREVLFKLPPEQLTQDEQNDLDLLGKKLPSEATKKEGDRWRELHDKRKRLERIEGYKSPHFPGEPNVLAHARIDDRVDSEGKRVLLIEEIQSDWMQEARKKGFKEEIQFTEEENELRAINRKTWKGYDLNEADKSRKSELEEKGIARSINEKIDKQNKGGVPSAPFSKTWHEFVLKRLIREAAEKGYDKIAWTTGEQQAERYDLSKQIDILEWEKNADGTYTIAAYKDENELLEEKHIASDKIEDYVGKDIASKILNSKEKSDTLKGLDLKVGGEGMKGFYDEIIPRFLNKFVKKWGSRVQDTKLRGADYAEAVPSDHGWDVIDPQGNILKSFTESNYRNPDEATKAAKEFASTLDMKVHSIELTPALKQAALTEGFPLFQEGRRGQIQIGKGFINIALLEKADRSTFLHETGHLWLNEMSQDWETLKTRDPQTLTSEQVRFAKDAETVFKWLGVESFDQITTEHQEKFARAAETYFMEGKAPTSTLRKAFASFRVWLTQIYRQLRSLNINLTKDVRGVFDRMIATEDEIAAANAELNAVPLFDDPVKWGMGAKAEEYQSIIEEGKWQAFRELSQKLLAELNRDKSRQWKANRAKIRSGIEAEVNQTKLYRAISILEDGVFPDGTKPEGMETIKLSKDAIVSQYGKEFLKRLPSRKLYATEGGIDLDVAAGILGFETADDMMTQIANAPRREVAIDTATEMRMRELYPDLLTSDALEKEAMNAVHNDYRSKQLRLELEHLASENLPTLKETVRKITRRVPSDAMVKDRAKQIIATKNIKDIKPTLFQKAETKAAKEAGDLLTKGDIDGAFEAKQRELLNHELYNAANEANETVEKSVKQFKKIAAKDEAVSKSRDIDLVNGARALLAFYGIGKQDKSVTSYLENMKRYDEDAYDTVLSLIEPLLGTPKNYDALTYDEFTELKNTVDALWELAKNQKQIEVEGQMIDRDVAIGELSGRLSDISKPGGRGSYDRAATKWDKVKMGLLGIRAALRRVESWIDAIDGGDIRGVFRKYLFTTISEPISQFREQKKVYLQRYLDIIKTIEKSLTREDIKAPEFGYTFSGKSELLGALLHTGNESNKSKLLRGRKWGEVNEDGRLDSSRFDAFIRRMWAEKILTKADYDYLQATWDLLEELKPGAQKAHKKMYGFYFDEITAQEFTTPFGTYRGGYVPAMVDPFVSQDAAIRGEKELLEKFNNSFMFPTTGRGFTKKRVEAYAAALMMDLKFIPAHIDKALRFTFIEPHVKDVSRIVMNRDFRKALDAFDPTVGGDMIVPWLQRSAQQKIQTPMNGWGGRAADTFFREVRSRTGLNIMVANVVNTIQQFTGLSLAAVKVKPRFLRNALWQYVRGPKMTAEMVTDKSVFMRTRTTTQVFEIQQTIDDLLLNPTKYEKAREFAKKHGYLLQSGAQNIVDVVAWSGAYNQAVENGMTETEAVRSADSAVRLTQGSFNAEDISRFETGTAFVRAFTMFYSYFNMQANMLASEFAITAQKMGLKKGAGRLLYVYTFGFMIPAVMSELIVAAMGGHFDEDDDDEYLDDLMGYFFNGQLRTVTAMFPFIGPTILAGINAANDKWYDDRISTSPAIAAIESAVVGNVQNIYRTIQGKTVSGKKAIRDALTAIGLATGMPVAPLARPLGYLSDIREGKTEATGPIDAVRGLITGKGSK